MDDGLDKGAVSLLSAEEAAFWGLGVVNRRSDETSDRVSEGELVRGTG